MLKISREVDLGLLLMTELGSKKIVSLSEWVREKKLPYRFLSKIAGKLKKAGLIESKEGREGGYFITKDIKIGQIFKAIEGKIAPVACLQGKKCKSKSFCKHQGILTKLSQIVDKQLDEMSLEELCR